MMMMRCCCLSHPVSSAPPRWSNLPTRPIDGALHPHPSGDFPRSLPGETYLRCRHQLPEGYRRVLPLSCASADCIRCRHALRFTARNTIQWAFPGHRPMHRRSGVERTRGWNYHDRTVRLSRKTRIDSPISSLSPSLGAVSAPGLGICLQLWGCSMFP